MKIAFIGLGNMGSGMAANLAKAGHDVRAFDLSADALGRAVAAGCLAASSAAQAVADADVVVTMGCGDACPIVPGVRYLDWDVADPYGADVETVRAVRDDIRNRVDLLLAELGALDD